MSKHRKPRPPASAEPAEQPVIEVSAIPLRRAASFVSSYVNNATVRSALYDMSIAFSQIMIEGAKPVVEEKCEVVMTPAHAKALAVALALNLKQWEDRFGEVKLPPGIIPNKEEQLGAGVAKKVKTN